MADEKKTKPKAVEPKATPKDRPAVDKAEAKTEAPAEAKTDTPKNYSRGEGQKPVSQAYKDNWDAIFGKKKQKH
jgi:hypothetical protein